MKIRRLKMALVFESILRAPADGAEISRQRKRIRCGNALNSGDGSQALLKLLDEDSPLRRLPSRNANAENLKREKVVGVEAGINPLQLLETAQHQAGSEKEDEG